MNVQELYQKKLTTAAEAVKAVKSGDWVDYGWCTNHPYTLDKALAARQSELRDVKVRGGVTMWMPEICKAEDAGEHFTWHSWHCSGIDRKIITKGMGYFSPMRYSELPRFYRDGNAKVDVAMIQVTPMDKHGNFSYALACSHLADMLDNAKTVIVEVNENLPWVYGLNGCEINIADVDMVVEGGNPPVAQLGAGGAPTEVDTAVANLVVPQIPNGACLQLGIGAIPDATGMALKAKHDLGIHTEMFTDSMVELIECGAVNNSKKQIHRGKTVTTFAFGSQRIYDYIDDNPAVEILPVEYVNDPDVICQNDNMISINAAVEVDLFGQVCAESVGTKHMSGSGGQIDYVRGACQSRGGKSFIAFTSTAKGGTISKIKSILTPGAVVTTSKNDVDYIVTEYGVAHLRGRSLGERARQLIAIAHPDFRDELTFEAKKRGIMI